ncbi:MAG: hypothetical protein LBQ66_10300 [Planctomycetaceae bacterium]|nr:hypothetical protein [Planctomycetaceae bacterium]
MANVLQHVLAFLPNSFGFLMHRGGRDARVPVRRRFAAIVCLSADVGRFGFADAFWRSRCRLAPTQPPGSRLPTLRSSMQRNLCGTTRALSYAMIFCLSVY